MSLRTTVASACLLGSLTLATAARATVIVAPTAETGTAGGAGQAAIFGNGAEQYNQLQEEIAASQLTALPVGSVITGIGYRLAGNTPTITYALTYAGFTIQIGAAAKSVGQLTSDLGNNYAANNDIVRAGALTLAANTLVGGASVNPFATIAFTTPYTYAGGNLLLTTSYYYATTDVPDIQVDAVSVGGVTDTAAPNGPGNQTLLHFLNAPVIELTYTAPTPVPEPATLPLFAAGLAVLALIQKRRKRFLF